MFVLPEIRGVPKRAEVAIEGVVASADIERGDFVGAGQLEQLLVPRAIDDLPHLAGC